MTITIVLMYGLFHIGPVTCPRMAVMARDKAEGHDSRPRPLLLPGPTWKGHIFILLLTNFNREYSAGMSWFFFSKLKAFSLSIVFSFLQLPIIYNKANVERPSIYFKLFNRKGCLILLIESKHRLPNFQLVFHQLFWLDANTLTSFSTKTSPQVLRNVWIRFTIMDLQYKHLVEDNHICISFIKCDIMTELSMTYCFDNYITYFVPILL